MKRVLLPLVMLLPFAHHEPAKAAPAPWIDRQHGPNIRALRSAFHRFGRHVENQAIRIAACESTGDENYADGYQLLATAQNGPNAGLLQINRRFHLERARRLGFTWDRMLDPLVNATVGADLYSEQGWAPWSCRWAA